MIINKFNKYILLTSLCFSFSCGKEISVFGAGNLDSSTPYGLNKAEKAVLKNNEKVEALSSKIDALELKLGAYESRQDDIKQRIEGIKSVYESDSQNINDTKLGIKSTENKIEEKTGLLSVKIDENTKKIDDLSNKLEAFIALQKKNNKVLEESNAKLLAVINKINGDYVTKAQYDELVGFINKSLTEQSSNFITTPQKKVDNVGLEKTVEKQKIEKIEAKQDLKQDTKQEDKELFVEALKLYNANQISKSMPMFEKLIENKYKPAESNFYFAEIKYRKKEYKDAIQSYKQSMIANDKADYIPLLLLHSAFSFEGIKQVDNATNFYKTIIEVYPDSKEAKEAKKKLKEIENQSASEKKVEKNTKKTKKKVKK